MNLEIVTVDLYPSEAKFAFAIKPESEYFQVELPGAFNVDSVRILNPMDTEGIRIFTAAREDWIPQSLEELKTRINEHTHAIRKLTARKSALEQTQILLQNAEPPTKTDAKDIISYIQMAQDMKLSTENELADIETSLEDESKTLQIIQAELQERMPNNPASVIKITGHIKSGSKLFIEAFTTCASWTPQYVMDLNSETGRIVMRLYSHTQQKTGLDYTGKVTFHTRHADESVVVPQTISPLRVSIKPKYELARNYHSRSRTSTIYESYVSRSAPNEEADFDDEGIEPLEAEEPVLLGVPSDQDLVESFSKLTKDIPDPQIEMTLFDHAIEGKGTLTGDGREAEFVLGDTELTGEITLELIPNQRNDDAWIMVKISNTTTQFIPGKAILKVDGHQTGSTDIPEYGLGQKSLPFGYVSQITAKKERHSIKKDTSWFNASTGGYTITVENGTNENKTVIVRDRLPVSEDEGKVKLDVKHIEPEPKERDKDNRLTWEVDIKAAETVKINVSFTLSYPLGEELQFC